MCNVRKKSKKKKLMLLKVISFTLGLFHHFLNVSIFDVCVSICFACYLLQFQSIVVCFGQWVYGFVRLVDAQMPNNKLFHFICLVYYLHDFFHRIYRIQTFATSLFLEFVSTLNRCKSIRMCVFFLCCCCLYYCVMHNRRETTTITK